MLEFRIGYEAQTLPYWLSAAIAQGSVVVQGDSTSAVQYYVVAGRTAGPEEILTFDGAAVHIKG